MTITDEIQACKQCGSTNGVMPQFGGFCGACLSVIVAKTMGSEKNTPKDNRQDKESRSEFITSGLATKLKPHQKEGVDFIWKNCFPDCDMNGKSNDTSEIGGCILAHYMGLGKSLTTITVLHTALNCPALVSKTTHKPLFRTVLMVVPANVLPNWEQEVTTWTRDLDAPLEMFNLSKILTGYREAEINKWKRQGGLLIMSDMMFNNACDEIVKKAQPDILVLDEGHTMLKNPSNQGFKNLKKIRTKRKIILTGTPLQNNVTEYFQLVEFIRPGAIGVNSVSDFENRYRFPIERGLPCDAEAEVKLQALEKQSELKRRLDPYVHRKGAKVLRDELPKLHDTILYLQASSIQQSLFREHKKHEDRANFFRTYADLAPVLNHPGTLKMKKGGSGQKIVWKPNGDDWVMDCLKDDEEKYRKLDRPKNSPKLIVLANILALAFQREEKTLVYSKCLKTLDLVEQFLSAPDWKAYFKSLKNFQKLGGMKKSRDYVRIDGGVNSGKRGSLVDKFNEDGSGIKVFLISSLAGGIGINLVGASVVVILDNHFNPAVSSQCISRAHRYGQKKDVRVFRLAIEDSIEAKVYARSVNKTGVAMRVLDGIFTEGVFSAKELDDLRRNDIILKCDACGKRRLLLDSQDPPDEDDTHWTCKMNKDTRANSCTIPEAEEVQRAKKREAMQQENENDIFLKHLRGVINKATRKTEIVTDYFPIEVSNESDICCDEAIAKLKQEIKDQHSEKAKLARDFVRKASPKAAPQQGTPKHGKRGDFPPKASPRAVPKQVIHSGNLTRKVSPQTVPQQAVPNRDHGGDVTRKAIPPPVVSQQAIPNHDNNNGMNDDDSDDSVVVLEVRTPTKRKIDQV